MCPIEDNRRWWAGDFFTKTNLYKPRNCTLTQLISTLTYLEPFITRRIDGWSNKLIPRPLKDMWSYRLTLCNFALGGNGCPLPLRGTMYRVLSHQEIARVTAISYGCTRVKVEEVSIFFLPIDDFRRSLTSLFTHWYRWLPCALGTASNSPAALQGEARFTRKCHSVII